MQRVLLLAAVALVSLRTLAPACASDSLGSALPLRQHEASSQPAADAGIGPVAWDGLSAADAVRALSGLVPETELATRGSQEAKVYREAAPSVVMVVTDTGLGSGSLISKDGLVLTSWHVVSDARDVGVLFKPAKEGAQPSPDSVIRATVVSGDPGDDLALLQVARIPSGAKPLPLGNETDIEVGADAHAIGHPTGEAWTYTKGYISQIREGYDWEDQSGAKHHADVIQTQTPINPGNSGGPLLSDNGALIGVNAFSTRGTESMHYAIGLTEVRRFLAEPRHIPPTSPGHRQGSEGSSTVLDSYRHPDGTGGVQAIDMDGDGKPDAVLFTPDDPKAALELWIDSNHDGKIDIIVYDDGRDHRWDRSLIDTDFDGKPDLEGSHPDGAVLPTSYARYGG